MEKKDRAIRRKAETSVPPASQPVAGDKSPGLKPGSGEDVALGRLSELADSARKKIMRSADSGLETAVSAQAELLKSRNKVEEVRKRIQSGYYGQPDIIGRIIDKLADDLRP
jgi:hypothetical protein